MDSGASKPATASFDPDTPIIFVWSNEKVKFCLRAGKTLPGNLVPRQTPSGGMR